MTLKKIFTPILLFLFNNLYAIDNYQQKIYDAEYCILIDRYDQAILRYNEAQRIRPIDLRALYNYFQIINCDSNLKNHYLDSLFLFAVQNEHISYFKKYVYRYLDSNEIKDKLNVINASLHQTDIQNRKAKIRSQLLLIQEEDQKIRREAISVVGRDSMYIKEPYRTNIRMVDSIHYIQFCQILKDINCDKYITDVILDVPGLMNHLLIFPDSIMSDKLSILLSDCINKEVHGKEKLATILFHDYNTSRYHKPNSNYEVFIEIDLTDNYLFYKFPTKEILNELNVKRAELGLESVERYLSKLIWTMRNYCKSQISIVDDIRKWRFKNDLQEKEFNEYNKSLGYKNLSVKCTNY